MTTSTDNPYALVQRGTKHEKDLKKIGWIVTDQYDNWLHMEPVNKCKYMIPWYGSCGKPIKEKDVYCLEHQNTKCTVCKRQATRACGVLYAFMCGAPLCESCIRHGSCRGD